MIWTVTAKKTGQVGVTFDVEAASRVEALRQVQGSHPIQDRWTYEVKRKEGDVPRRTQKIETNGSQTPPPAPEPVEQPAPPVEEAKPATPERKGSVRVCVPVSGGVGVIAITSVTKGGDVTKRYLVKCLGSNKFSLTGFVEDGGGYYTVIPGTYCGCEDHKRHGGECKHLLSVRSLIRQGKL